MVVAADSGAARALVRDLGRRPAMVSKCAARERIMATEPALRMNPMRWDGLTLRAGYWAGRLAAMRGAGLPAIHHHLATTGRIDAFRLEWRAGQPDPPHIFWDSDVAKWLEAAAYALASGSDEVLAEQVDSTVALICQAQQPDGYLNVHFTVVRPEQRWANLRDWHELYCAGHLLEAAVALDQALGDRRLLDAMERYVGLIATVFGTGEGQRRGYPGHEELELALVKLHRHTGSQEALDLARYFIDERGRQPHYYRLEAEARGEDIGTWWNGDMGYNQSHLPVREQTTAEGHSVRAMYLYCAMADLAAETGDAALRQACRRLWENVTRRRMYVTGGLGSSRHGERFTRDYDLPNETAYAETCAAIGLVMWAQRMLQMEADAEYADVMELALYNGVMSGIPLPGTHFFYANPLRVDPRDYRAAFAPHRQDWFGCACCPTNLARLLTSLGRYAASEAESAGYLHLFAAGEYRLGPLRLEVTTDYPYDGRVRLTVLDAPEAPWTIAVRRPGWARAAQWTIDGDAATPDMVGGYALFRRVWARGTALEVVFEMPAERLRSRPEVVANAGRVALRRGPLVYCLEEADNGPALDAVVLPDDAPLTVQARPEWLGGTVVLCASGRRERAWNGRLYAAENLPQEACELVAVPYALWQNRGEGEMTVWIRSAAS